MKKLWKIIALTLVVVFAVAAIAAAAPIPIVDPNNALTKADTKSLEGRIKELERKHNINIGVLLLTVPNGKQSGAVASGYLTQNGYANAVNGGVVLLLDLQNHGWYVATDKKMEKAITAEYGVKRLGTNIVANMKSSSSPAPAPLLYYDNVRGDSYADVIKETVTLPLTLQPRSSRFISTLTQDAFGIEAFGPQALILKQDNDYFWYPQYQATVALAVREDIGAITGWEDVLKSNNRVALTERQPFFAYLLMGLTYGLSGTWDTGAAMEYLQKLQQEGRLDIDSRYGNRSILGPGRHQAEAPIRIMFDYEIAQLNQADGHYKIVIPREGTLTFTKGLLTKKPLYFNNHKLAASLVAHGFRPVPALQALLPDQVSPLYPKDSAYHVASNITDPEEFHNIADNLNAQVRRQVYGLRLFATADGFEHYFSYYVLLAVTVLLFSAFIPNILQPGVRHGLMGLCLTIVLLIVIRVMKLGFSSDYEHLVRWCWYAYYLGFDLLGLFLLWIAWATDKPAEVSRPPRWWYGLAVLAGLVQLFVFTNDYHQLIWQFQPGFVDSNDIYTSSWLLYAISIFYLAMMAAATGLLIYKALRNTFFRTKVILPVTVLLGYFFYMYGYNRWLFFQQTELIFTTCLVLDLFALCGALTGLFTVNKNYVGIFKAASLGMQIADADGKIVYASGKVAPAGPDVVIHRQEITAGQVIWYEDVKELNELKRRLRLTTEALQRSQMLLAREGQIRGSYLELRMRNQLYDELERILATKNKDILSDLHALKDTAISPELRRASVCHLNILACFLKKKCVMLLHGKSGNMVDTAYLTNALTESCRYATQAGLGTALKTAVISKTCGSLRAMFLYDAFEEILETALSRQAENLLVQLTEQPDKILTLSCYVDGDREKLLAALQDLAAGTLAVLNKAGARIQVKDLDDAVSLTVSV